MEFVNFIGPVASIIGSTIVAVVAYIGIVKNNKMQFITAERSLWRKELRELNFTLELSKDTHELKMILAKLRNLLNPYGDIDVSRTWKEEIMADCHIWRSIHKIERLLKGKDGCRKSMRERERLGEYVRLSLKYDWERSKNEADSGKKVLLAALVIITGIVGDFAYYYIGLWL